MLILYSSGTYSDRSDVEEFPFLEMVTLMCTGTDITEWTVPTDLRVPIFTNTCYQLRFQFELPGSTMFF